MTQHLDLQIDKLVLHGFPATDAPGIKAAIEQELGRLFSAQGIPAAWSAPAQVARLNAGSFSHPTDAPAEAVGSQIAQTIFAGFTP